MRSVAVTTGAVEGAEARASDGCWRRAPSAATGSVRVGCIERVTPTTRGDLLDTVSLRPKQRGLLRSSDALESRTSKKHKPRELNPASEEKHTMACSARKKRGGARDVTTHTGSPNQQKRRERVETVGANKICETQNEIHSKEEARWEREREMGKKPWAMCSTY